MKKKSLKTLKNKLDVVFSIYIRKRGADEGGTAECITCQTLKHWKDLQCGHWHSRRHLATRWHPLNAHSQCGRCNVLLRGNYTQYAKFMYRTYTIEQIEELETLSRTTTKLTRDDLEQMIEKYK